MRLIYLTLLVYTLGGCRKDLKPKLVNTEAVKYNHLAVEQQMKHNPDSGLFYINKAIEIDSSAILFHVQKVQFLWALGRNQEALETSKIVSRLRHYKNLTMEGIAYERLKDVDKARELYKKTIDNWPTKELEEDYQSRIEYSILVTVVYGSDLGLKEIDKIDKSKLPSGQDDVVNQIRQTISKFNGLGYLEFK
jgi:tetratricopeptide (TPR) repeat protein